MAFGPATTDVEQALLTLLQGRDPSPLSPTFGAPPIQGEVEMRPMPPPLPGPVDAEAIRSRFAGLAGPEPVAPTVEPAPLIIRIARALQGFGAGVQGQGPQFLAQLAEQRERPQREYRAQKERFDTRKQELATLGEQAVLSAEDRRVQRTQQLLDKQAERDFEESVKRAGLKSAEAIAQMRAAFELERDAKKAEFERLEQERRDAKERKMAVITLANTLTDDFKISREQAKRFAQFEIDGTPLSAADAKQYSRIEKYRRPVGGSASSAPSAKVMVEVQNADGSMSVVPYASVSTGINAGQIQQGPRGVFVQGQASVGQPASPVLSNPPIMQPLAESGMLSQTPGRAVPPSAPPGTVFTRAEVQAHARKFKRDPASVEADIRAAGGTVR
jgi:hypothetical protein